MRRRDRFIHNELPMLRARSLRAAPVAPSPRPAAPPIYETSHQIREKHQTLGAAPRPCFSTLFALLALISEISHSIREKSRSPARVALLLFLLAPVFLVLLTPTTAHAQAKGAACPVNGYTAAATQATGGQNLVCGSLTWNYVPYQFGASAGTCPGASNVNLGMIQWTGAAFQGCTASGWGSLASGGATALSSLTSGTAVNTIDSTNFAQTWTWNSLTTQTAFTLSSSSLTNGNILSIQNSAASATSTGKVVSISDATTGAGYGVYSVMSGKGNSGYAGYFTNTGSTNTGYAGYFANTDTSSNANYGIYASAAGANANAGYFNGLLQANINGSASANVYPLIISDASAVGGLGIGMILETPNDTDATNRNWSIGANITHGGDLEFASSASNSGSPIGQTPSLVITSTGSVGIGTTSPIAQLQVVNGTLTGTTYAGYFSDATTGSGYGVYGTITGHGNTGYAGYFVNTDTSVSVNYGVYGYVSATTTSGNSYPTGVYGEGDCANCIGVSGSSTNDAGVYATGGFAGVYAISPGAGTGYGVYGTITGHGNTGYAGYFTNTDTSTNTNYGVYATILGEGSNGVAVYGGAGYSNIGVEGASSSQANGIGVYGLITGHGNTGYAGYFINTDTSTNQNYGVAGFALSNNGGSAGVYGESDIAGTQGVFGNSTNGAGVFAQGGGYGVYATSGGGSGVGVLGQVTAASNTGYAGYFYNADTSHASYGVFVQNQSTGAGYGVYGTETGAANTGYGGYFANTGTGAVNYGVYSIISSATSLAAAIVGSANGGGANNTVGVWGTTNATGGGATGVYGTNTSGTGNGAGVWGTTNSTNAGFGVYGAATAGGNSGYAGYFTNTSTAGWAIYAAGAASFAGGYGDSSHSIQTPTTGFNITIANNVSTLILTPAGTLATGTIKMPAAPFNGQIVNLVSTKTVTALTLSANTGQTINNAVTTIGATSPVSYIYDTGNAAWYRLH
jgi:hypothetical protein